MTATPTGCNPPKQAFTTPEGWQQKAQAADEIALLNRKANALTDEIDKLERRIEALERNLGGEGVLGIISNLNSACNATAERVDVLGRRRPVPTAPSDQFEADTQAMEYIIIGKAWREDSSLERWFPITAEELKKLKELNEDKFKTINAYCKMASLDKWKIKTLIEAIDRFLKLSGHADDHVLVKAISAVTAANCEIPEPESKWRDAKTDPPKESGDYLISHKGKCWLWYYVAGSGVWRTSADPREGATHWQPLPAPPKEGV